MTPGNRWQHILDQIIRKLTEGPKQAAAGKPDEVCRHLEVAESNLHRWLAGYGAIEANGARRLKKLGVDGAGLKKLVAVGELNMSKVSEPAEGDF
jgi:putative transposase